MKGKRIRTLVALIRARDERRAVVGLSCWGVRPAAWVVNLSGEIIHREIQRGMWVYRAKRNTQRKENNT